MLASLDLRAPKVGASVQGAVVVKTKEARTAKSGLKYLTVVVGNATGDIQTKVWPDGMPVWGPVRVGAPVAVQGKIVKAWRGNGVEFELTRMEPLPATHPVALEINRSCPVPRATLELAFDSTVAGLRPSLQALVRAVVADVGREAFLTAPAAKMHHHNYISGLVEHSLEVATLAERMAGVEPYAKDIDRDLLVAGALLHDVAKTREYQWLGTPIDTAPMGRLRYHTAMGPELVAVTVERHRAELDAAGLSVSEVVHIQHIQESHHRLKEHGSPTAPSSLEAMLVHVADLASAELRKMMDVVLEATEDQGGWALPTRFGAPAVLLSRPPAPRSLSLADELDLAEEEALPF